MIKKFVGITILLALGIALVINVLDLNNKETSGPNLVDVTGDTSVEGVTIVSPGTNGLNVGDQAPEFELPLLNGDVVKLSDLKGKKVLINFWATWCPPCKEEMPEMQQLYEEYGDDITIIAINATGSERNESAVRDFIDEYGYTFPVAIDKNNDTTDNYMAYTIPTSYFIGTDGVIQVPRKVGPMTYDFMVEMMNSLN
ncbi:redoxin domain-containing protein [Ornithinibacillus sp. BX22]|uniref:Redoxin domain-containing protein n=2 Tax=Ornithinibacillus TaxID=484508 RepID=A0A923RGJ6_9BACI|nr:MULTISPECIES: TlpA family protein disulfide reductase [Ornithinibacillus]MBC5636065.1 redoxin domain-containing protein [Ornithinibacillus hominis]MBS3679927.1 redoxin domain-containing protein [Ornithinibacillus massiliensis]